MRRDVCLGLLALAVLVAPGCDSDQPLAVDTQNAALSFKALGAQVPQYFVWDLIEAANPQDQTGLDVDGDGVAGDVTLWCQAAGNGNPQSVPWTYAVKVQVIRNGEIFVSESNQVVPEQLTSAGAAEDGANRAPYDTFVGTNVNNLNTFNLSHARGQCSTKPQIRCNPQSVPNTATSGWCFKNNGGICQAVYSCSADFDSLCDPNNLGTTCSSQGAGVCTSAGVCSGDPGIVCEPTCGDLGLGTCVLENVTRTYKFRTTNRRRLTAANRELLNAKDNFIAETCRGDAPCVSAVESHLGALNPALGICPGQDLGNPVLDPFTDDADADPAIFGFTLNKGDTVIVEARRSNTTPGGGQIIPFVSEPGLLAEFFVDGAQLQSDEIVGSLVSTPSDDSPNVSFSFTSK